MPSALLIGDIVHARKEWESLSSILTLKVRRPLFFGGRASANPQQEFPSGGRQAFIQNCQAGQYDDVIAIYRSNTSNKVRAIPGYTLKDGYGLNARV